VAGKQDTVRGAQTPEELEMLLEDALVVGDANTLTALFEEGATLVTIIGPPARGGASSAQMAMVAWGRDRPYLADPQQVVIARDVALVVGKCGITVARRGGDGAWQYAIVLQTVEDSSFSW
jgi:hypothetical protein